MFDLLIRSAFVIDGTGRDGFRSDIGISHGRIAAIGTIDPGQAAETLDASGLVVTPGFIDSHSHSDTTVYRDPSNWNKLEQGITTDVGGMCGLTLAPISRWMHALVVLTASETFADPATAHASRAFHSYANFRRAMDQLKLGTNMAVYVGHHLIRGSVLGMANRAPRDDEMRRMKRYLREAMECGALGLSLGLIYPPGAYAQREEIHQLCQELAPFNGQLIAHMRSESDQVVEAVEEMLSYGRSAHIPISISHHKVCGKQNWGRSAQTLERIDRANREGLRVWLDAYPYTAGATNLRSAIPPRFHARSKKALLRLLKSSTGRTEIRQAILEPVSEANNWENFHATAGFEGMLVANAPHVPEARGKTIAMIAQERGVDPFDALFDLLLADNLETNAVYSMMDWQEVKTILTHPRASVGTDGAALSNDEGAHPRLVGTFPRFISKFVREEKLLTLPQAVHKITGLAAEAAGLQHKGRIAEGWDADLVLFDPHTIQDSADFMNYRSPNTGIHAVLVGGLLAVKDGKYTGVNNGKFLWKN
jgi:N-acyl-D-amino-acid deacylase